MLKHVRDAIRRAGLKASQVTFIPAPGHGILLFNGHRLTCSCSPKDPHTASLRIARDLLKLK